jgi:hypothetical protein
MCRVCFRSGKQINGEALSAGALSLAALFFRRQYFLHALWSIIFPALSLYLFVYRKLWVLSSFVLA